MRSTASGELLKDCENGPATGAERANQAFQIRRQAAEYEKNLPLPDHSCNSDEVLYPNKIGNFSKGLPHNKLGEVELNAYEAMMLALTTGNPSDFEKIPMAGVNKLVNPQAALAFELEGPDSHHMAMIPPPAFSSAEQAGEIAENYWMALARDVHFSDCATNHITQLAATDLSSFSDFRGPKVDGRVTPATLFRADVPGSPIGPYISQFLWLDAPFGAETIDRRMRTVVPGVDYMTKYEDWLAVQNGALPGPDQFDPIPRYIRNGRDLGQWVHVDVLFQAYFTALLILFSLRAPFDAGNPYNTSRSQIGFGTLGEPYIASVLCAVATRALKAVWYQKWMVHRRLRPEEFAGRIHNRLTGAANYPIHPEILKSAALDGVYHKYRSYLLPQAYPEGCPAHPSYGAGHATVAGACVTILKAFFDESFVIPKPMISSADGLSLIPYDGMPLTVGGELNKLASNVAFGRNFAGIHWRADGIESLKLGEEVAIHFLKEEKMTLNEKLDGFTLTKFDGTTITV
ncbi:vanadium-dependent haloperoxidase [Candidatus Acetothermia bacterium]|nr:vanadium-dependent haloperoxidase [Candidatus Acetothermia bacterium]